MTDGSTEDRLSKAAQAIGRRDGASARRLLQPLIERSPTPASLFLMVQACRVDGDDESEMAAIDQLLELQPTHLGGLLCKGAALARAGNGDEAVVPYQMAVGLAGQARNRGEALPPMLANEINRAAQWVQGHAAEQASRIDQALEKAGIGPGKRSERIDEAVAILRGEAPVQLQQPSSFYYPGLSQRPFFERADFGWAEELESHAALIRAELQELLGSQAEQFSPYVPADADRSAGTAPNAHLAGDSSWSAYHLIKGGEPVEGHAGRFPATLAALGAVPMPRIAGRSPMALFSMLKPGGHIRPHHGLFNFRLICHLPLIVPGGCTLRVGNQRRDWREGELLIFDDSMQHEAWNRSDQQRIILLFEIWRPDIDEADRQALTVLLQAANISAED